MWRRRVNSASTMAALGDRPMTPVDYRATLATLGISQARLGRLLSVNKDTPTNWSKGNTEIPTAVALLLELMARGDVSIDQLEAL